MSHFVWDTLGIDATDDARAIKRAYAHRLKQKRPEDDSEAFQRLRHAYEWALHWAQEAADAAARGNADDAEHNNSPATVPRNNDNNADAATSLDRHAHGELTPAQNDGQPAAMPADFATAVPAMLARLDVALADGEIEAVRALKREPQDALSFAEREQWELAVLARIAMQESFPLALAQAAASLFRWQDRDSQQTLYRLQPQHTGRVLTHLAAEWQRQQLLQRLASDPLSLEAWSLLNGMASRWEMWKARLSPALMQRLIDILFLLQHEAPALWQQLRETPAAQYWQRHARQPRVGNNAYLTAIIAAFVVFFSLLREQGMVVALLGFVGVFVSWCGVTYLLQLSDETLHAKPRMRLATATTAIAAHIAMMLWLLLDPNSGLVLLIACIAIWPVVLVVSGWWPQALAPIIANRWLALLLLIWAAGLVATLGRDGQGRFFSLALLCLNLFLLMRAIKDVLSLETGQLPAAFQLYLTYAALAISVALLALIVVQPDNIEPTVCLFAAVALFASAWRPPDLPLGKPWRIGILLGTLVAVPSLIDLLPVLSRSDRYVLQSFVMMLVISGLWQLAHRWQNRSVLPST